MSNIKAASRQHCSGTVPETLMETNKQTNKQTKKKQINKQIKQIRPKLNKNQHLGGPLTDMKNLLNYTLAPKDVLNGGCVKRI